MIIYTGYLFTGVQGGGGSNCPSTFVEFWAKSPILAMKFWFLPPPQLLVWYEVFPPTFGQLTNALIAYCTALY